MSSPVGLNLTKFYSFIEHYPSEQEMIFDLNGEDILYLTGDNAILPAEIGLQQVLNRVFTGAGILTGRPGDIPAHCLLSGPSGLYSLRIVIPSFITSLPVEYFAGIDLNDDYCLTCNHALSTYEYMFFLKIVPDPVLTALIYHWLLFRFKTHAAIYWDELYSFGAIYGYRQDKLIPVILILLSLQFCKLSRKTAGQGN